jgi:multidrug efflux pump subunit AcrA (membrane-fusion protein)
MTERTRASWLIYALGALCIGAILAAVLVVGPASSSQATVTRTATVADGVVQSTVSGSGNLQAVNQLNLGFKTSGTVTHIYVSQGEQVAQGQLLATLDPQSAEVTLEQSKAALQSAEANLAKEEETDGEGSSGQGSSGSGADASASTAAGTANAAEIAYVASASPTTDAGTPPTGTPTTTTDPDTTTTTTSPGAQSPTVPASSTPTATHGTGSPSGATPGTTTPSTTAPSRSTTTTPRRATSEDESDSSASKSSSAAPTTTVSAATREANLASARAAVKSDRLTVQSDEQAVQDTKLYAPESGTIVSLSGQVGEVVSGGGTTRTSSSSGSSGSTTSGAAGSSAAASTGRSAATGAGSSSTSASDSSGSSSSTFAILSDLSSMQLVVPLSESEIGNVKDGQIATVTVEALEGRKLAAHVSEVALLSTSSSGAVSYDVTFQLDQLDPGLKLGMSATGEVVVKQAEGLNVPTSAISAGSVTVLRNGAQVHQRVVTGLAGNTSTIILGGLKAGETIVLPTATSTGSGASSILSKLGSRLGGVGGAGLGGGGLGGGGGGAFFRGGG